MIQKMVYQSNKRKQSLIFERFKKHKKSSKRNINLNFTQSCGDFRIVIKEKLRIREESLKNACFAHTKFNMYRLALKIHSLHSISAFNVSHTICARLDKRKLSYCIFRNSVANIRYSNWVQ